MNKKQHADDPWESLRPDGISPHYVVNQRNAAKNTDKPFVPSYDADPSLIGATRWEEVQGYIVLRRDPYGHWNVHRAPNGEPIPAELSDKFTSLQFITKAIEAYVRKETNETKTS